MQRQKVVYFHSKYLQLLSFDFTCDMWSTGEALIHVSIVTERRGTNPSMTDSLTMAPH